MIAWYSRDRSSFSLSISSLRVPFPSAMSSLSFSQRQPLSAERRPCLVRLRQVRKHIPRRACTPAPQAISSAGPPQKAYRLQRSSTAPTVKPAPTEASSTRSPFFSRPSRTRVGERQRNRRGGGVAVHLEVDDDLVVAAGPSRSAAASMMRRLAWCDTNRSSLRRIDAVALEHAAADLLGLPAPRT